MTIPPLAARIETISDLFRGGFSFYVMLHLERNMDLVLRASMPFALLTQPAGRGYPLRHTCLLTGNREVIWQDVHALAWQAKRVIDAHGAAVNTIGYYATPVLCEQHMTIPVGGQDAIVAMFSSMLYFS